VGGRDAERQRRALQPTTDLTDGRGGDRKSAMPESGTEAAVETIDRKAAAAKSGRRTEAAAAHSKPAAMEAATTVETATAVSTTAAVTTATTGQGRVRRQHGDRCSGE